MKKIAVEKLIYILGCVAILAIIIIFICTLGRCFDTDVVNSSIEDENMSVSPGLHMPDTMKELSNDASVKWMSGIWVDIPNCQRQDSSVDYQIDTYVSQGRKICATVIVQNGLNKIQPYYLIILADGIPIDFYISGKSYKKYSLMLSNQQTTIDTEFEPTFSENLGRLDFLLFYDGDPLSDYHMIEYTVHIMQNQATNINSLDSLSSTRTIRHGIRGLYTDGTYNAWLWPTNESPSDNDIVGPRKLIVDDESQLLLEAVAAREGTYRTILLLDGEIIPYTYNETVKNYCDWISKESEMLQLPIQISIPDIEAASFFTVSTPLDPESFTSKCMASVKIQLLKE